MSGFRALKLCAACVPILGLCAAALPDVRYAITDLNPGAVEWSSGAAINDLGQAVGRTSAGSGFIYTDGFSHNIPGSYNANDINNSGDVVGQSALGTYLYSEGTMTAIGGASARSINDRGQIVGIYDTWSGGFASFTTSFFYSNGTMSILVPTYNDASWATSLNNNAVVVGGHDGGFYHPSMLVAWPAEKPDGTPYLPSIPGIAWAINDSDQVVGSLETGHAFLYSDGIMLDLGTLGGGGSGAWNINEHGQVVGLSYTASGEEHAFLYSDGVMSDLNAMIPGDSGWTLLEAADINENGQIVGKGIAPNGRQHAFLLTPVPEPATLSLLALGGLAVIRRRRE